VVKTKTGRALEAKPRSGGATLGTLALAGGVGGRGRQSDIQEEATGILGASHGQSRWAIAARNFGICNGSGRKKNGEGYRR